jgi:predicted nucleic acid-binding protein
VKYPSEAARGSRAGAWLTATKRFSPAVRGVRLIGIDRSQLRAAAQLRALHRIRTPDALQLAAALSARCTAFVTNDRRLPEIPGLRILQLRDY